MTQLCSAFSRTVAAALLTASLSIPALAQEALPSQPPALDPPATQATQETPVPHDAVSPSRSSHHAGKKTHKHHQGRKNHKTKKAHKK